MEPLDDLELRVLERTGDLELAIYAREFMEAALICQLLRADDLQHINIADWPTSPTNPPE